MLLDEVHVRREKLEALERQGVNPYPATTHRTAMCGEARDHFDEWVASEKVVTLAGRLLTTRIHGGIIFADLKDESGTLQLALKEDAMDGTAFTLFRDTIDPADIIEATGTLFATKRGEQTLSVQSWTLLTKTLLPLPEKWHGLTDVELRFRKRYLDLIMNPEVMQRMVARSKILSAMQRFLNAEGFLEVETPTLQPVYGGGFARPFVTHHQALDADFYLRISSEMYLKRLQVGGMEKVYDIKKVFRNEGIDRDHNPEFTMFEAQIAYADYNDGMDLFERIFETAAQDALGTTEIQHGDIEVSVKRPWNRVRLIDAVREIGGLDPEAWSTLDEAKTALRAHLDPAKTRELDRMHNIGEVLAFAFEECVEEKLIQPTLVYDFPTEVSPLAKKCATDSRFTERFEAFALGHEIGNNYTELNDPIDLEKRFIEEKKKEEAGFDEAHQTDYDYLEAIQHGLPPSCGLGIGIDRMVMLLTGAKNIKEVILFPTLRPESHEE